jgi:hypothetical protein
MRDAGAFGFRSCRLLRELRGRGDVADGVLDDVAVEGLEVVGDALEDGGGGL